MPGVNCNYSDMIAGKWKLTESVLHMNRRQYVVPVKSDNFFVEFCLSGKAYWQEMEFKYLLYRSFIFCSDTISSEPEIEIIRLNKDILVLKIPVNTSGVGSYYLEHFERVSDLQKTT